MGISQFPSASGGAAANYDFVVDMNDTTNNVIELGSGYIAGAYNISLASGDSSFDIYLVDENGDSVGYSNSSSIVATGAFETVVVLGVATDEVVSFTFTGAVSDASAEGTETGAGAYLTSISPSDLPAADDTATVIGGNFSTAVEIYFESGTVSKSAKNITRTDSTALIVTRPDEFDPALDPWDVKAINPGVTPPTGSNAHILAGTVDAGAVPVFTTTSPLTTGTVNSAYAGTIVATDADGSVTYSITAGSVPAGISFNSATGVLSGTPTAGGETFTVQALDEGGNSNTREFTLPIQLATGGSVTSFDGKTYHIFETSDDFVVLGSIPSLEYLVVAGGAGGGATSSNFNGLGGGGGAGGLRNSFAGELSGGSATAESPLSVSAGTIAVTVGAGGNADRSGVQSPSNANFGGASNFGTFVATVGGGIGGIVFGGNGSNGGSGGSGGGAGGPSNATTVSGGNAEAGEGSAGGNAGNSQGGSGGGALESGSNGSSGVSGGAGLTTTAATSVTNFSEFAAGGDTNNFGQFGANAIDGTGSGGGGGGVNDGGNSNSTGGGNGGDGIVILRY